MSIKKEVTVEKEVTEVNEVNDTLATDALAVVELEERFEMTAAAADSNRCIIF